MWAVERRENLLEDQSVLNEGKAGQATIEQVFDSYIGWLKDSSITAHVRLIPDTEVGSPSSGAWITTAYATWDFNGKAGAKGLSGLVFIDGASGVDPITPAAAKGRLDELAAGSPWLTFGGIAAPFTGLVNSNGSLAVELAPNAPSDGQASGLLPANLVPRVLDATRALARQSGIPADHLTLVDRHTTYAHNDPNTASPKKNAFLRRLTPFQRSVASA